MSNPDENKSNPQMEQLLVQLKAVIKRQREYSEHANKLSSFSENLIYELEGLESQLSQWPSLKTDSTQPPQTSVTQSVSTQYYDNAPHGEINDDINVQDYTHVNVSTEDKTLKYTPPEVNTQKSNQIELNLGIKWLSRIGIAALLMGLAMALSYSFPHFSNEMKLLTGFILSGGFFVAGTKLFEKAPVLSRILQGGGVSIGYLSLFALFFIPEVQLLQAPAIGFIILFAYVSGILWLAHKMNSETIALISLAFGYYTATSAMNYQVAFLSTALLTLATVGIAKLHPYWRLIAKVNLLGTFWTYLAWHHNYTDNLSGNYWAQAYLIYTFSLFHVVSILRSGTGDTLLNVLNTFGFYMIYLFFQPQITPKGLLEFSIAGIQFASLGYICQYMPQNLKNSLSSSLLIIGLTFLTLAIGHFFNQGTATSLFTMLSLSLGLLSKYDIHKKVMTVGSYTIYLLSSTILLFEWNYLSDANIIVNTLLLTLTGFILESVPFKTHSKFLRGTLMGLGLVNYLLGLMDVIPSEWRSISLISTGFTLMAIGFLCSRKTYRWLGLAFIFIIGGFSFITDMLYLEMLYKIILFILLGIGLLVGSYGYVLLEKKLGD